MAKDGSPAPNRNEAPVSPEQRQYLHRAGMIATLALLAVVLVALPLAIRSMAGTLFGAQQATLYDLVTGGEVQPVAAAIAAADQTYINLAVVSLDPATGQATLAISGNRVCAPPCPTVQLTLLALDDNAALRRGLPPWATITLAPDELIFSESVLLPVRGRPNLYPFDTYDLWLGFAVLVIGPDSKPVPVDLPAIEEGAVITLQNQLSHLEMDPPRTIEPTRAMAVTDPYALPLVEALHFARPDYLKILAVLLIVLIAVSGGIALLRRDVDDLLLGIGGLILGIWGIRSVLVTQPLPGVSAIDLALSFVILFLLLGLTVRLTRFFHRGSNWRWPFPR
jgi:hypothetical protein